MIQLKRSLTYFSTFSTHLIKFFSQVRFLNANQKGSYALCIIGAGKHVLSLRHPSSVLAAMQPSRIVGCGQTKGTRLRATRCPYLVWLKSSFRKLFAKGVRPLLLFCLSLWITTKGVRPLFAKRGLTP